MKKIGEFIGKFNDRLYRMEWIRDSRGKDYAKIISSGQIISMDKIN